MSNCKPTCAYSVMQCNTQRICRQISLGPHHSLGRGISKDKCPPFIGPMKFLPYRLSEGNKEKCNSTLVLAQSLED